ncbi:MAG: hypothetical protein U1F83_02270 [Verrucomicrobiota bacterium]
MFNAWQNLQRRLGLDRLHLPEGISAAAFIVSLFVPGLAFIVRKQRLIGQVILLGYGVFALVFVVWLGYPIANVAFGLMLSAHLTSVTFLLHPWLATARFGFRIVTGLILLLVIGGGLYAPLRNELQTKCLLPLRIKGNVVVVQTFSSARSIRRADWIIYEVESLNVGNAHREGGAVLAQAGFGWGPVLGMPGDRILFTSHSFELNGVARPRLPHMPAAGEFVVPEKHWFIWPELAISNPANASEAAISATMLRLATVSEAQFVGKPFKRWFWRRQHLS